MPPHPVTTAMPAFPEAAFGQAFEHRIGARRIESCRHLLQFLLDTRTHQECSLGSEACDFEPGSTGRVSHCREIHPRRNVAEPGVNERITMRMVAVMAAQAALHPIRV